MKPTSDQSRGTRRAGFTLIELLVVIAIIGILAALLLPTMAAAKKRAQITKAKMEINGIVSAIRDYEADNSLFPVSKATLTAAAATPDGANDFTFGTANLACAGPGGWNPVGQGFSTASGGLFPITSSGNPTANNSEVISILMDLEKFGNGIATVNAGHARNPKRTVYLNASLANDDKSPGVGTDGVYRDPWGNPYIITLDLNGDNRARDVFYSLPAISSNSGTGGGYNGLVPTQVNSKTEYEANLPVMVWSVGPDKQVDTVNSANQGANKDNVTSWKP